MAPLGFAEMRLAPPFVMRAISGVVVDGLDAQQSGRLKNGGFGEKTGHGENDFFINFSTKFYEYFQSLKFEFFTF